MKTIKNNRGFAALEVIILVLALGVLGFVGYRAYQARQAKPAETAAPAKTEKKSTDEPSSPKLEVPYSLITDSLVSPDGSYVLEKKNTPGVYAYTLKDKTGKIIADGIPTEKHSEQMGLGTKIKGQYGVRFAGWHDKKRFVWRITTGAGDEYEYLVDGSTGAPQLDSYQQTAYSE